jgi:hypothetical protein
MTAENKESVFHKLDEQRVIADFADSICGSDQQAGVFTASCAKFFEWSGGRLFFKAQGGEKIAAIDPRVKEFFKTEYPFLLPTPKAAPAEFDGKTVDVDPAVVASALAGNFTAKGRVVKAFGDVAAAELFLKAEAKKQDGDSGKTDDNPHDKDHSENPWAAGAWSLTRQGAIYKSDPALAQRLAKSAGSFIGATKPGKAA